jgi:transposase
MKKNCTVKQSPKRAKVLALGPITIGLDLGDKTSRFCVPDQHGRVQAEGSVATTRKGMTQKFSAKRRCRIALEVGTHSLWLSRLLSSFGHHVIVANAGQTQLISASSRKDDRLDAEMSARLARVDPELLRPIHHRGKRPSRT